MTNELIELIELMVELAAASTKTNLVTDLTQQPEISEAGQKRCGWH